MGSAQLQQGKSLDIVQVSPEIEGKPDPQVLSFLLDSHWDLVGILPFRLGVNGNLLRLFVADGANQMAQMVAEFF
jgi:hypothetical protein